ncbi:MAG: sulfatase [Candidatus Aminicenantes bacterium]|nr:sulfatase [Candidatus Aminicenantes bacterium]
MGYSDKRREFIKTLGWSAAALALGSCGSGKKADTNIVVIFTDDQGYADLGCYGAEAISTPHIDALADQGVRFTDFYSAHGVCSASRAALLTGCYGNRVSVYGAYGPHAKNGLHPDEETLAEVLKKRGYVCGIFGKWHLGHHRPFLPLQQGFDEYFGLPYSNDMWPIDYDGRPAGEGQRKRDYPWPPLIDGNDKVGEVRSQEDQDRLTVMYTEKAVDFINRHRAEPFFLYVPHSMPHTPLGVSDRFKGKSEYGRYGDVIMEIDWSVGQILKALKENRLDKNTLIIYTSDNGPWLNFGTHAGSAGPFREGKGTAMEGGMRVPCIIQWPGHTKPGSISHQISCTIDLLPTLAAVAEAPLPDRPIDGVDLRSVLEGDMNAEPRRELAYFYGKTLCAVREERWKLHFPHSYRSYEDVLPGLDGLNGPYARGETGIALYDLDRDPGERYNVAENHPDIVARLLERGEYYRSRLGDGDRVGSEVRPPGLMD